MTANKPTRDDELDEEIRSHLAMSVRDRMERGESRPEAEAAARRELGNVALVKEVTREMWGWRGLERLIQDLAYAARLLRRSPGFTLVALLSLTLGIGVNTAIFQVINAVRLRTLPVTDPGSLALLRIADLTGVRGSVETRYPAFTNPLWEELQRGQEAFSALMAWQSTSFNIAPGGVARPVRGLWVSGRFFDVLGMRPAAGRLFSPLDDQRGCVPRAVVSHGFWMRELGGRPTIGTTMTIDGHQVEIIGVSAEGFTGVEVGRSFDVALPVCAVPVVSRSADRLDAGTIWWLTIMGRLKPGWSVDQASSHLAAISPTVFQATLPADYPGVSKGQYLQFKLEAIAGGGGVSGLREDYSGPLWLLLATAGLVLVIACVNLANLMLARASAREREFAVRLSLGASRGRVIRQLLVESLLLACLGAVCGTLIASPLSRALISFLDPEGRTISLALGLDWRVITFTVSAGVFTCVLFGLLPAIRATRMNVISVVRSAGRGLTSSRERFALRRGLVILQVALSLMLLVGALLFAQTLRNLLAVDPGFTTDGVVVAAIDLRALHTEPDARRALRADVLERVRAIPGVRAAAEASIVPVSGDASGNDLWMEGNESQSRSNALFNRISAGYFAALEIPMASGRDFTAADTPSSPLVAIVNSTFVRVVASGQNPVGRRFKVEATPSRPETAYLVVGVVEDATYLELREDPYPVVFLALNQVARPGEYQRLIVRSSLPQAAVTVGITETLQQLNPSVVVSFTSLKTQVLQTLARERLMATLSGFFGALAGLLAVIGLYGVISYTVARRTHEIGIRMALGASRAAVVRMIMREASLLIVIGIVLGTVLALATGRTASALLFGLESYDPGTLGISVFALALVALAASYLPARAAATIEPVVALRVE